METKSTVSIRLNRYWKKQMLLLLTLPPRRIHRILALFLNNPRRLAVSVMLFPYFRKRQRGPVGKILSSYLGDPRLAKALLWHIITLGIFVKDYQSRTLVMKSRFTKLCLTIYARHSKRAITNLENCIMWPHMQGGMKYAINFICLMHL